jgi:oligoribonuclease NrnB/cAMP/cGMP phosphodiesterase (DHH superfamily)
MKTYAIYHRADYDGLFCREIARQFLPEAVLLGWDYGDPTPQIPRDAHLYLLDLSVPDLMGHPGLVWIDHHRTAIERYPKNLAGYRIDGVAACRLAWQWFTKPSMGLPALEDFVMRKVEEPLAVRLAGEYDIWDRRDERAALLQHGLRSQEPKWDLLLAEGVFAHDYVGHLLECGRYVAHARREGLGHLLREGAFALDWQGLRWVAINAAGLSSDAYEQAAGRYDAGLSFCWAPKKRKWRVSMRALRPGLDLSQIAQAHGGGGHRAACGFEAERLPFDLA